MFAYAFAHPIIIGGMPAPHLHQGDYAVLAVLAAIGVLCIYLQRRAQ